MAADFYSRPSTETSRAKESELTKKMWKVPLLLLVLGRASLWFLAEGGKTRRLRLPTAAGRGEGALTCWNAWVWHLRLTGKAEGSSGVCAQESGGPRRKGSGPAGARSHRKSCAGCQKEPLNPQSTKVR